jgi:hypothetical protein
MLMQSQHRFEKPPIQRKLAEESDAALRVRSPPRVTCTGFRTLDTDVGIGQKISTSTLRKTMQRWRSFNSAIPNGRDLLFRQQRIGSHAMRARLLMTEQ